MATLYITEYTDSMRNTLPAATEPENTSQTVAIGGSSTQSSALQGNTKTIRLHTDAICSILVGTNPTAATTNKRMTAGQTEYFSIAEGSQGKLKVAVISNT